MRIDVQFDDQPGFTEAFLGLLVLQHQSLRAMEVVSRHVYADLPDLNEERMAVLLDALRALPGFVGLRQVTAMPRELRLRQLEAVIEAMPDPVLAINNQGLVVLSNSAAKASWGRQLAGRPVDEVLAKQGWDKADWQPGAEGGAEFLDGEVDFAGKPYLVERIPIPNQGAIPNQGPIQNQGQGGEVGHAGAVLVLRAPRRLAALRDSAEDPSPPSARPAELAADRIADTAEDSLPASFADAQQAFEAELLRRLFPRYPSSRKLAKRLKLSHTAVANKLRSHGIRRSD